jgi:hypothetical protein
LLEAGGIAVVHRKQGGIEQRQRGIPGSKHHGARDRCLGSGRVAQLAADRGEDTERIGLGVQGHRSLQALGGVRETESRCMVDALPVPVGGIHAATGRG